jgi:hypothetical protein
MNRIRWYFIILTQLPKPIRQLHLQWLGALVVLLFGLAHLLLYTRPSWFSYQDPGVPFAIFLYLLGISKYTGHLYNGVYVPLERYYSQHVRPKLSPPAVLGRKWVSVADADVCMYRQRHASVVFEFVLLDDPPVVVGSRYTLFPRRKGEEIDGDGEIEGYIRDKDDLRCNVCLEDFVSGDLVGRVPCRHLFHTTCLKRCLEQDFRCPLCRRALEWRVCLEDE